MMDCFIFGGSGFVGQHLAKSLEDKGYNVWIPSRRTRSLAYGKVMVYDPASVTSLFQDINNEYCVVNLAGESINSKRWSAKVKAEIMNSRIHITNTITEAIAKAVRKPHVFVNASAIGFYGYSEDQAFTEADRKGEGFLPEVASVWEDAALRAMDDTRVVLLRLGVVLGLDGGALPRMAQPYRWFVGGRVGSGKQVVSWVHIEDVCGIILHSILNGAVQGPVNVTAPEPVTMDQFGRELAVALQRPHWIPVPGFALKLLLGEMSEIVLKGQKALPNKIKKSGYSFHYSTIAHALQDLYNR